MPCSGVARERERGALAVARPVPAADGLARDAVAQAGVGASHLDGLLGRSGRQLRVGRLEPAEHHRQGVGHLVQRRGQLPFGARRRVFGRLRPLSQRLDAFHDGNTITPMAIPLAPALIDAMRQFRCDGSSNWKAPSLSARVSAIWRTDAAWPASLVNDWLLSM